MRLLPLTDVLAAKLLAVRRSGDAAGDRVAARIIADVRRRGDAALFSWSRQLDRVRLTPKTMWIARRDIESGGRDVSPALRDALAHAARNIRRVAEQQRPRSWSVNVEP